MAPWHHVCLPLTWEWAEPPAGLARPFWQRLCVPGVAPGMGYLGGHLCGDAARPSSPLFPSFQLTVEMFDYLECELNLFQTGKPLIAMLCRVWYAWCGVGSRKELSKGV